VEGVRVIERLLVVSNGFAEDAIAAVIVRHLVEGGGAGHVAALPLVGEGRPYEGVASEILGPRRRLPSDGLTMHHPVLLWRDLRAGLLVVMGQSARTLLRSRPDAVLAVGDVVAHAMAALVPAPRVAMQTLVSVRSAQGRASVPLNRAFMERIHVTERELMRRAARVYTRDDETAAWLRERGVVAATCLGSPMMDDLGGRRVATSDDRPVVGLLPGMRTWAHESVARMLAALALLGPVHALVAWGHVVPAPFDGWVGVDPPEGVAAAWARGDATVWWLRDRFVDVLATADVVLGTSGTAHEQAVGLGLPVIAFPLPPSYTLAFVTNQQRLLGDGLRVVENDVEVLAAALRDTLHGDAHREAARRTGPASMGAPGAGARIAADLVATLAARVAP
jgi:uncharacterized protein (TIGR03492 family)